MFLKHQHFEYICFKHLTARAIVIYIQFWCVYYILTCRWNHQKWNRRSVSSIIHLCHSRLLTYVARYCIKKQCAVRISSNCWKQCAVRMSSSCWKQCAVRMSSSCWKQLLHTKCNSMCISVFIPPKCNL